jgi:hypothetical protein
MLKSKALDILGALSPEEMKEFRVFIISPYFNTNNTIIKFFDILAKYYPGFKDPVLTKEFVFKKLNPQLKYKDEVIRNLFSRLLSLGEEFLRIKGMQNDEYRKELHLITELNKRKVGSLFEKNVQKLEKLLPEKEFEGNSYQIKMELESQKFVYSLINKKISSTNEIEDNINTLIRRGENLINYFVLTHLKEMDFLRKFSNMYNVDISDTLPMDFMNRIKIIELVDYLRKTNDSSSVVYDIHYNLLKAYENFDEINYYYTLKKLLLKSADAFSKEEKHFLFGKLIDYGVIRSRMFEDNDFDEEHFSNYVIYLENEYYAINRNDYLPLDLYRNILILGLRRGDYAWTEEFIKKYIKKLNPDYQENTHYFSKAFLYFQKKEFEKALSEINKVVYDFFAFKYDVRNLTLMICYELGNWEMIRAILESYKRFLMNNKMVGKERKEFHGNFIKVMGKLTKVKSDVNGIDKVEKGYLRKEITDTKNLLYKDWILEKVDSL